MTDTRWGKPVVRQFRHSIPSEAVLLAAPSKRSTPEVSDVMPERRERPAIRGYRIIGEVACYDLPQPASLIWDRLVHSLPQLSLDFLELRPHVVAPGLPLKLEGLPSRFAADEGEPTPLDMIETFGMLFAYTATFGRWRKPFRARRQSVATCGRRIELVVGV